MDLEEKMEAMSGEAESMMAEMGALPEESTAEHPASAYLRSQLEEGLKPEQLVGAAAVVRAVTNNKRLWMQAAD